MANPAPGARAWAALWRTATRVEPEKVVPGRAARNALGVAIPLAAGYLLGSLPVGLIVSSGALNVCFTDGDDPYRLRARRMLLGTLLVGLAVFTGTVSGHNAPMAIAIAGIWAFAAGMMAAISQTAADMGVTTLVTVIVFSAQPLDPHRAVSVGLLAIAGGLLQTALALALWPVEGHAPERRALANLFEELARAAESPAAASEAPLATAEATEAHRTLAAVGSSHSVDADRYRSLLVQAQRIRLTLMALARLRVRIGREDQGGETAALDRFFALCSPVLASIGASLKTGGAIDPQPEALEQMAALAEALRLIPVQARSDLLSALVGDALHQMDALAGQLRSSVELAAHATPTGLAEFDRAQSQARWTLRLRGSLATLRANLSFESAAFRHAVRLAACVALGDGAGRLVSWHRTYWLPMTVAIVLRPDFSATFTRGALRVAGTLLGLAFATALFHFLPLTVMAEIVPIALLTFVLRSYGAANYGILTAAVSALVVLLIALTGVAPSDVIAARALNSVAGGALALAAYWLWPTWERYRIKENVARLLDAYREYFHAISEAFLKPAAPVGLDAARQAARLARSNLEASVDRLSSEPYPSQLAALNNMLASSHRLVHALMALEAGLYQSEFVAPREAFRKFSGDVERTLFVLAVLLRGSAADPRDLPDLREDHHALLREGDSHVQRYALANIETDRVTNALNTLREQIVAWPS